MCFFGHKFGKIERDGYQYCIKCGKAHIPPHEHRWILKKETDVYTQSWGWGQVSKLPTNIIYFYECSICGETKKVKV